MFISLLNTHYDFNVDDQNFEISEQISKVSRINSQISEVCDDVSLSCDSASKNCVNVLEISIFLAFFEDDQFFEKFEEFDF
jgi:hypothetical protein